MAKAFRMKVVIAKCNADQYFAGSGEWVHELDLALEFPSSYEAIRNMHKLNLRHAKVALKFGEKRYDIEVAKTCDCRLRQEL